MVYKVDYNHGGKSIKGAVLEFVNLKKKDKTVSAWAQLKENGELKEEFFVSCESTGDDMQKDIIDKMKKISFLSNLEVVVDTKQETVTEVKAPVKKKTRAKKNSA